MKSYLLDYEVLFLVEQLFLLFLTAMEFLWKRFVCEIYIF